jgi:hypothetical protein
VRSALDNTYSSELRRVVYRWHPYHGQALVVRFEKRDALPPVVHCEVPGTAGRVSLEIPNWMFDVAVCSLMRIESAPCVSWTALMALAQLLSDTAACASHKEGESHATRPTPKENENNRRRAVELASPAASSSALGAASRGRETTRDNIGE